ncbi:MAG: hypothetical protein WA982_01330 [Rubrobacteraceae bacterium]
MKASPRLSDDSDKILYMDTRNRERLSGPDVYDDGQYEEPGLGAWLKRNPWLLLRLFMVMVFTFGASTVATNFTYGLQWNPVELSVEEINDGRLPAGLEIGDYVEIYGTPDIPDDLRKEDVGRPGSKVGSVSRYSTGYYYYQLEETNDNLLLQSIESIPRPDTEEAILQGKLSNVGTVIFHDATQEGLNSTNLPHKESTPVIETGDTPEYYRQIFPAYATIIGLGVLSVAWLVWKKNKPFA